MASSILLMDSFSSCELLDMASLIWRYAFVLSILGELLDGGLSRGGEGQIGERTLLLFPAQTDRVQDDAPFVRSCIVSQSKRGKTNYTVDMDVKRAACADASIQYDISGFKGARP